MQAGIQFAVFFINVLTEFNISLAVETWNLKITVKTIADTLYHDLVRVIFRETPPK